MLISFNLSTNNLIQVITPSKQEKFEDDTDTDKPYVNPSSYTLHSVFFRDGLICHDRGRCSTKCSMLRGKI